MSEDKIYANTNLKLSGNGKRIAIVAARFNNFIVDAMVHAAVETLWNHEVAEENIKVYRVPGAFELPLAAQKIAAESKFDAVLCFGCVIRGDTPHFDYVCNEAARGIQDVALKYNMPVIFGVLTTDNTAQAEARVSEEDNKGNDAALAALEMLNLFDELDA